MKRGPDPLTAAWARRAVEGISAKHWFIDTEFERDHSWWYGDFVASDVEHVREGSTCEVSWTWRQGTEVGTATATFTDVRDAWTRGSLAMENMWRDRESGIYRYSVDPRLPRSNPAAGFHTYVVLLYPAAMWLVEASSCTIERALAPSQRKRRAPGALFARWIGSRIGRGFPQ